MSVEIILLYKINMTVYNCKPHVSHFAYYIVTAHTVMGNCSVTLGLEFQVKSGVMPVLLWC